MRTDTLRSWMREQGELALNSRELPSYVANIKASLEDYRGILDEISAEAE